jgi:N-methylhydantoinase A
VQTVNSPLRTPDWSRIRDWYKEKEAEAKNQMQGEPSIEGLLAVRAADIRYAGQGFNTEVALTAEVLATQNAQQLAAAFVERYAQLYGVSQASVPGEIVNIRLTVIGKRARVRPLREAAADSEVRPSGSRSVYFDGARRMIPVFPREHLGAGALITGPCVIDQSDTTILVRAGWHGRADEHGNLQLSRGTSR